MEIAEKACALEPSTGFVDAIVGVAIPPSGFGKKRAERFKLVPDIGYILIMPHFSATGRRIIGWGDKKCQVGWTELLNALLALTPDGAVEWEL